MSLPNNITIALDPKGLIRFECDHIRFGTYPKICDECGMKVLEVVKQVLDGPVK